MEHWRSLKQSLAWLSSDFKGLPCCLFRRGGKPHLTSRTRQRGVAVEVNHIGLCRCNGLLQLQSYFFTLFVLENTNAVLLKRHNFDTCHSCSFIHERMVDFVSFIGLSPPTLQIR